ncbi:MAG: tRNA 2-thiouridine(34) synthase MnmA [Candidatus Spechtbacteria bacterium SB0662_bin_43]|uniref:tRNA-specific 2-thiouridylase MnmA n=1 Tax=Candidatus Spechtbacteria bacterium SB0662_bin_43 TaxID=2604897 RepID=A0A845DAF8_9BACT|nr:tRNA 2-thiouridine(34) synthase MnmA [Candidatus Spechtbacteria bacterium SB0662_bin_43]
MRHTKNKKKVVVAMSGGVDSSVSAGLLLQEGYDVVGVFMKCWDDIDPETGVCSTEEDEYWARRAAAHLGIPFYRFNFVEEYRDRVYQYFIDEYNASRTPNPDVLCNSEIKFGVFFDTAMRVFAPDNLATGHYARVQKRGSRYELLRGVDSKKDQSYFLYRIPTSALEKTLFPVGWLEKEEVRERAVEMGLPNAQKKDSQGLCFIGNIKVSDFLRDKVEARHGDVVTQDGVVVGKHKGLAFYTIGQRRGVGSFGGGVPYFVIDKNKEKNELVVGGAHDVRLFKKSATLQDVCWINNEPDSGTECAVAIRYRQEPQRARVEYDTDSNVVIRFEEPQRAITEGQSAVIYHGDVVLGGGVICY